MIWPLYLTTALLLTISIVVFMSDKIESPLQDDSAYGGSWHNSGTQPTFTHISELRGEPSGIESNIINYENGKPRTFLYFDRDEKFHSMIIPDGWKIKKIKEEFGDGWLHAFSLKDETVYFHWGWDRDLEQLNQSIENLKLLLAKGDTK